MNGLGHGRRKEGGGKKGKRTTAFTDRNSQLRIYQPFPPCGYDAIFRGVEIIACSVGTPSRGCLGCGREFLDEEGWS